MAFTQGWAESHIDFLNKLKTFVCDTMTPSGDRWISQRYTTTSGSEELIVRGKGYSGTDQIYIGLKAYSDSVNDNFALIVNGFTGFNNSLGFYEQPGAMTISECVPVLPLLSSNPVNANAIKYWIMADAAHIKIICRTGTVYHQAYLGFYLPYGTPPTYPYPLIAGGSGVCDSTGKPQKQSDVTSATHAFWKPIDAYNINPINAHVGSLAVKEPGGSWKRIFNTNNTALSNYSACTGTYPYVEETRGYLSGFSNMRSNLDGSYTLQPIVLIDGIPANTFGEFTNMRHVTGFNLSSEDVITIGSDTYLVIQNVFRTGDSDMVAYKLA
ncbi:MAG TPA: hypothetical protein PLP33_25850 [Leptospiraceae bacterium]|nr:hypothetical protein [Leptospiraceae bacterium]